MTAPQHLLTGGRPVATPSFLSLPGPTLPLTARNASLSQLPVSCPCESHEGCSCVAPVISVAGARGGRLTAPWGRGVEADAWRPRGTDPPGVQVDVKDSGFQPLLIPGLRGGSSPRGPPLSHLQPRTCPADLGVCPQEAPQVCAQTTAFGQGTPLPGPALHGARHWAQSPLGPSR